MFNGCDGFGKSWEKQEKRFNFMWNFITGAVILIFTVVIAIWSLAAFGIFKGVEQVKQHGLKSIVEEVWNGKDAK